jgi:hypothetical protein
MTRAPVGRSAGGAARATRATGRFAALGLVACLAGCRADAAPTPLAPTSVAGTTAPATEPAVSPSIRLATERAQSLLPEIVGHIGTSGETPGTLRLPFDVAALADGSVWVSDSKGVQLLSPAGELIVQIDPTLVPQARGIDADAGGRVFVTGYGAQVLVFGADGTPEGSLGAAGTEPGQLAEPTSVTVADSGEIFVVDAGNKRVEKFGSDGSHALTIGGPGQGRGEFSIPWSVAVDADGRIYVSTADNYLIQRFAPDGTYIDAFGQSHADENIWQTAGLAAAPGGPVYALQSTYNRLQAFDVLAAPPRLLWEFGSNGFGPYEFGNPSGTDLQGDRLYVAETANDRIKVIRLTDEPAATP